MTKKKWLNRIRYGCSAYIFTIVRVNHYVNVTGLLASTSQIDLKAAGTFGPIQSNRLLLWLLQFSWDHNIFHRLKMWPWPSSGLGSTCVMSGHPNVTTHLTFAPCKVESGEYRPNVPAYLGCHKEMKFGHKYCHNGHKVWNDSNQCYPVLVSARSDRMWSGLKKLEAVKRGQERFSSGSGFGTRCSRQAVKIVEAAKVKASMRLKLQWL